MKPKIVVIGSANTDLVVNVDKLPEAGETVLGKDYTTYQGGKGANQAVAAARLGAEITFICRLGQDKNGQDAFATYKEEGINTDYIVWDEETPSGIALIIVKEGGDNIIAVAPGANGKLSSEDVKICEEVIKSADCILLQLEIPIETVVSAIDLASKHGVRVILNPAPATDLPKSLKGKIDTLTPNETEVAILGGGNTRSPIKYLAYELQSKYKINNMVVTLGEKGALISSFHHKKIVVPNVESLDATGAGDASNGALAVALARKENIEDAVRFANSVAAISTTRLGAQNSFPSLDEVKEFIKDSEC